MTATIEEIDLRALWSEGELNDDHCFKLDALTCAGCGASAVRGMEVPRGEISKAGIFRGKKDRGNFYLLTCCSACNRIRQVTDEEEFPANRDGVRLW